MQRNCICDEIYQTDHDQCEPSTKYLCDQKANRKQARFELDGREITRKTALTTFRQMLEAAHYPLITGLSAIGSRSQRVAVAIGKKYGAVVDSGAHPSPNLHSLARIGAVTASMGEVVKRSDRLLLIGCDPSETHPRFFKSFFHENKNLEISCWNCSSPALPVSPKFELTSKNLEYDLMLLHAIVLKAAVNKKIPLEEIQAIQQLYDWLVRGNFATILVGTLAESIVDTVTEICKALTNQVRIVSISLADQSNKIGAEHSLAATTGFADAVDFSSGYARSFCSEYSSSSILARGEADLLVTFDANLSKHDHNIPTIVFGQTDSVSSKLNQRSLRIDNLSILGDDFHRFDHLQFGVRLPSDSNSLESFLQDVYASDFSPACGITPVS